MVDDTMGWPILLLDVTCIHFLYTVTVILFISFYIYYREYDKMIIRWILGVLYSRTNPFWRCMNIQELTESISPYSMDSWIWKSPPVDRLTKAFGCRPTKSITTPFNECSLISLARWICGIPRPGGGCARVECAAVVECSSPRSYQSNEYRAQINMDGTF